jgi:hypothetical protein
MAEMDLELALALVATREDIRVEGERLRQYMTTLFERQARKIDELIEMVIALENTSRDS